MGLTFDYYNSISSEPSQSVLEQTSSGANHVPVKQKQQQQQQSTQRLTADNVLFLESLGYNVLQSGVRHLPQAAVRRNHSKIGNSNILPVHKIVQ